MSSNDDQDGVSSDEDRDNDSTESEVTALSRNKIRRRYLPDKDTPFDAAPEILKEILETHQAKLSKIQWAFQNDYKPFFLSPKQSHRDRGRGKWIAKFLTPIHILTNDILLLIFKIYVSDRLFPPEDSFQYVNFAPWLLSQVCREWRDIIFSSSSLWGRVTVMNNPLYRSTTTAEKQAASYLLSRQIILSGTQPLELTVDFALPLESHYPGYLIDILIPHRHRWQKLLIHHASCDVDDDDDDDDGALQRNMDDILNMIFPSSTEAEFSILEELLVSLEWPGLPISNNNKFPRLRLASFSVDELPFRELPGIPWSNINHLHLPSVQLHELISLLLASTNLKQLSLGFVYTTLTPPIAPPIVLPLLEKLCVDMNDELAIQSITTPSLNHLILNPAIFAHSAVVALIPIMDLVHRSSCSISTFHIILPSYLDPQAESLLSSLPHMTSIYVRGIKAGAPGYRQLKYFASALRKQCSDGQFAICPHLTQISLSNEGGGFNDEGARSELMDLIEARHDVEASPLNCVKLDHCLAGWKDEKFDHRLKRLRSEGLDFQILPPQPKAPDSIQSFFLPLDMD